MQNHIDNLVAMQLCPACGTVAVETPLFHLQTYMRCNNCKDDIANLKPSFKTPVKKQKYNVGDHLVCVASLGYKFTIFQTYIISEECGINGCSTIIDDNGIGMHLDESDITKMFSLQYGSGNSAIAASILNSNGVNYWTLP